MEKPTRFLERPAPSAEVTGETAQKQNMVASLRDLRPAVPKVELASHGGIDVLAALRKRPLLAFVVLAAALTGSARYVLRHVPRAYHAEASIYVSPTYFKNLQQDREQLQISYSTLVNQQILTIRRFDILRETLERLQTQGIQWRRPGESDEASVGRLAGALEIKYIPDSYEVLVGLDGPTAETLAPILNTITQTYLEKGKQEDMSDRSSRLAALTAEQANVAVSLQQKLDEQAQFSQKLTTLDLGKAATADDALLTRARQALEDAHRKRVEAETQVTVLQGPKNGAGGNLLTTLAQEAAMNDANTRPQITTLNQRFSDLQKSIEGLTQDHPLRQSTEKEMATIQDQVKKLETGSTNESAARMLAKVGAEMDRAMLLEGQLSKEVDEYTSRAQSRAKEVQLAQGVNDEIDRLRRQQNAINGQIDALSMPGDTGGYLRIFSAARTPLEPNKSNSKKMFLAALAASLFLTLGVVLAMDMIDQRIFTPAEVKRAVGFPPVGMVLESTPGTSAFSAEHFRRLVNGIQRGAAAQGATSIVLTPLRHARTPGTLSMNIGRVLVARGLKVAIIDANPNAPDDEQLDMSGSVAQPGLDDSLQPGIANHESRLPARIEMGSAQEISAAPLISRISGMLESLEQEYDIVLIDAPPLGVSADTEFLATISDIALLVVEAGEATRAELIRCANVLGRVETRSVGVILSQVRLRDAGSALKRDFKRYRALSSWSGLAESTEA